MDQSYECGIDGKIKIAIVKKIKDCIWDCCPYCVPMFLEKTHSKSIRPGVFKESIWVSALSTSSKVKVLVRPSFIASFIA
jgi:hypothetical protein